MNRNPEWHDVWQDVEIESQKTLEKGLFSAILDQAAPIVQAGSATAIEIGCFPGKFIDHVGGRGYRISGIDTYPRVSEIAGWSAGRGRIVERFECASLEDFSARHAQEFDLVFSLGLIEHFDEFCEVIHAHSRLCKVGGTVLIGAPNFASPLQRALHSVLDARNLEGHVLHAMYPDSWAVFLAGTGFEVVHSGNAGGFGFWTDSPSNYPRVNLLQKRLPALKGIAGQLSEKFNREESSYGVVVARRVGDDPGPRHVKKLARLCRRIAVSMSEKDEKLSGPLSGFVSSLIE